VNPVPAAPKIYQITHVDNLASIVKAGRLWSDAKRIAKGFNCALVGMSEIKRRRVEELPVPCHPGTMVGQYVPFFFCPRSIMLYILHKGNHPDLRYREGQRSIVHLQAELNAVVHWADDKGVKWAFSTTNAGARYARFFASLDSFGEVSWTAVEATDFREATVKDRKQAEFLLLNFCPWSLVEKVGVVDNRIRRQAQIALASAGHRPAVAIEPTWYY
jgi:hypothetical protein